MITFSQTALAEIKRLRNQHGYSCDAKLLLESASGGCMEWHYNVSFVSSVNANEPIFSCEGIEVIIPASSQNNLSGLHIDYSEDLMGGGFRFTNPNATQTCGCGNSFSTGVQESIHAT